MANRFICSRHLTVFLGIMLYLITYLQPPKAITSNPGHYECTIPKTMRSLRISGPTIVTRG